MTDTSIILRELVIMHRNLAPKTNQEAASQKRRLIIKAAIKVFAERGYHNSRVSDIVKEVGAAQGVFYYYFKSKEEALLTIFEYAWNNLLERMGVIEAEYDNPLDKLKAVIDYIFASFKSNPNLMKVLIMDVPRLDSFYDQDNQILYNKFFQKISEVIEEGQQRGLVSKAVYPPAAAYMLHGAVDSLIRHHVFNPQFDAEAIPVDFAARQTSRVLMNGLIEFAP